MIVFEIIHHMQIKSRSKKGEITVKIYINEAYDKVDWNFLRYTLLKMGLGEKWVNWVMMCVKMVRYMGAFNGRELGPIVPSREFRQGDPYSSFALRDSIFCIRDSRLKVSFCIEVEGLKW